MFCLFVFNVSVTDCNIAASATNKSEAISTAPSLTSSAIKSDRSQYKGEDRLSWDSYDPLLVAEASFALANVLSFLGLMHNMVILGNVCFINCSSCCLFFCLLLPPPDGWFKQIITSQLN